MVNVGAFLVALEVLAHDQVLDPTLACVCVRECMCVHKRGGSARTCVRDWWWSLRVSRAYTLISLGSGLKY